MDEVGNVQFLSREDDLIKSSGYRIGPEEIEEALVTHKAVADAGVVGVPDPVMGQKTKAFVVLKAGTAPSDDLKKELIEHCKGKVAVNAPHRGGETAAPDAAPAGGRESQLKVGGHSSTKHLREECPP
jgi:acyl-coenzyme A synthetase/AMP-(fatty) acid ligase